MRLLLLYLLLFGQVQAQNTLILGRVQPADTNQMLILSVNRRYLDQTIQQQRTGLTAEGRFAFALELPFPQLVQLQYRQQRLDLYLSPGDTLVLEGLGQVWTYGGSAKDENEVFQAFQAQFPLDRAMYRYSQYPKNGFRFLIHEEEDALMRKLPPDAYWEHLQTRHGRQRLLLQRFLAELQRRLDTAFVQFLEQQFRAQEQYHLLAYAQVYEGRHRIGGDFLLGRVDSLAQQRPASLGNEDYRLWMQALLHWQARRGEFGEQPLFLAMCRQAQEHWPSPLAQFMVAYTLEQQLFKQVDSLVLAAYEDFLRSNPYLELDQLLVNALYHQQPFAAGRLAPNFSLPDAQGHFQSLEQYRGKVVYLDFWASWCRPCVAKHRDLEPLKAELAAKGVVFVHISLDQEEAVWKASLRKHGFSGVQLLHQAFSGVREAYQVLSVPRAFVLNRRGEFVACPQGDLGQLRACLLGLD
jgi:peroxiredoxin